MKNINPANAEAFSGTARSSRRNDVHIRHATELSAKHRMHPLPHACLTLPKVPLCASTSFPVPFSPAGMRRFQRTRVPHTDSKSLPELPGDTRLLQPPTSPGTQTRHGDNRPLLKKHEEMTIFVAFPFWKTSVYAALPPYLQKREAGAYRVRHVLQRKDTGKPCAVRPEITNPFSPAGTGSVCSAHGKGSKGMAAFLHAHKTLHKARAAPQRDSGMARHKRSTALTSQSFSPMNFAALL